MRGSGGSLESFGAAQFARRATAAPQPRSRVHSRTGRRRLGEAGAPDLDRAARRSGAGSRSPAKRHSLSPRPGGAAARTGQRRLERVIIESIRDYTYYPTVVVAREAESHEVDARPSDALNLAVRVGAPVFVAAEVIHQAGRPEPQLPLARWGRRRLPREGGHQAEQPLQGTRELEPRASGDRPWRRSDVRWSRRSSHRAHWRVWRCSSCKSERTRGFERRPIRSICCLPATGGRRDELPVHGSTAGSVTAIGLGSARRSLDAIARRGADVH